MTSFSNVSKICDSQASVLETNLQGMNFKVITFLIHRYQIEIFVTQPGMYAITGTVNNMRDDTCTGRCSSPYTRKLVGVIMSELVKKHIRTWEVLLPYVNILLSI